MEWIDVLQDANEERFAMLAMVENRLLFVSYTVRGLRIRIISARKATRQERIRYDENREKETLG